MKNIGYILKSVLISFRYSRKNFIRVPIRSSWITRIKLSKRAEIVPSGTLHLGLFRGEIGEFGQIKYDRTILQLAENSKLITGNNVNLGPGVRIILGPDAVLTIGENTYITANSTIICTDRITIGKDCIISWDVQIMDSDFHHFVSNGNKSVVTKPITIEDKVWIGSKANILKGVKICSNSIIATNSLVTKDVPVGVIVAGNPAKVIKENIEWFK